MKEIFCFLFDVHFDVGCFVIFTSHSFYKDLNWTNNIVTCNQPYFQTNTSFGAFFNEISENQAIFVKDMGDMPKAQYSH